MPFIKRLGFYLFGISIGILFLAFFFKKKTQDTGVYFCYFPNCRTLKDIRSKPMYYSDEVSTQLLNKQLDSTDIVSLLTHGDVDFGSSETKSTPCKTYIIEGIIKDEEMVATVRNCRKKVTLERIVVNAK
ncbi:MAG: hypothetical protein ACJAWH_000164 [Maribacter sp.]|jgi:hypothetical protein